MLLKRKVLSARDGVTCALLALSIVSILTFPVSATADEPGAPGDPVTSQGQQPAVSVVKLERSDLRAPVLPSGLSGLDARAIRAFTTGAPENTLGGYKLRQPRLLPPLFGAGRLADQTAGASQPEPPKTGVNKRYLALGIFGLVDVAAGAIAASQSNKYCLTTNITTGGQSQTSCNSFPTAGKVLIPVGAAIAGLGFYMAFRHRH